MLFKCNDQNEEIIKVEKRYELISSASDTILKEDKIYYKNGDFLHTVYFGSASKLITLDNEEGNFKYQLDILEIGSDTISTFVEYDVCHNRIKYTKSYSKLGEIVWVYKNFYNKSNQLTKQIEYGNSGKITCVYQNLYNELNTLTKQIESNYERKFITHSSYIYDTLGYSKIKYECKYYYENSVKNIQKMYYQNDKIVRIEKLKDTIVYCFFEYLYDSLGRLIIEDLPDAYVNARYTYVYENNYLSKIIRRGRSCEDGSFFDNESISKTYSYEFDKKNRPIKIIEKEFCNGEELNLHITTIEYFNSK
jgi:hypothetical protein